MQENIKLSQSLLNLIEAVGAPDYLPVMDTINAYMLKQEEYLKNYQKDDVRIMFFAKTINTLYSYQLERVLINGILNTQNSSVIELIKAANLGIILKMGENFQIQHSIYNASLCYIRLFCSLESTLREIYSEFGYIPKKKNSFIQFSEISSTIINDFKLDKKYIKLLELLATIRNLMHEFGVSNKNKEIKYNGKTYKFEKGKFPKAEMVKLVSLLEFYRIDVLTLMDQMFQTEKFKNKQYIKDYLSPNKQHYKNWINGK